MAAASTRAGSVAARLLALLVALAGCAPAESRRVDLEMHSLAIQVDGAGRTDPAPGIRSYPAGARVQVTASPDGGATFAGWGGDASGTASEVTVEMSADRTLVARFSTRDAPDIPPPAAEHTLTIETTGTSGTTRPPPGVHAYPAGTFVEVDAVADSGARFCGWSGAAVGTSTRISVTTDADKRLTARFAAFTQGCAPAPPSGAAWFAAPAGTGTACTLAAPCTLATAAGKPSPGETVYLRGGTYAPAYFEVARSGDPVRGWITFAAYPGELPVIDGGVAISGSYVRFDGLVARHGSTGFANRWTGGGTTSSNGHLEFLNCIADLNTMAGIAFRSAAGVHVKQCIVAHNGSSTTSSWSSGVDLFGAQGSFRDNVVESTVAFENVDMQHHSDGSGFIVDDIGTGATFVNDIGFRNGGSCIRLTTSRNTHLVNNTCYHDGLDPQAGSDPQWPEPKSPGEILFSSAETWSGSVLLNNLAAASGWNGTQTAYVNTGSLAVAPYNLGVDRGGATPFFQAPEGASPDFRIAPGATAVVGAGTTNEAPATDIGFDPRCITRAAPAGSGVQSWWIYTIDYDYVRSVGGVAGCFAPRARSGAPDLGAYAR